MPPRKKQPKAPPKSEVVPGSSQLSTTEQDLLWHMAHGYQLETSSLWDNPILRRLRDNTEVHATANRSTIEALQKAGLIAVAEEGEVVHPTVWRLADKRLLALTALKKTA